MHVTLHRAMAKFVEEQVKGGRYATPEDEVNGALSVLQSQQDLSADGLAELKKKVAYGLAQADRGELEDWDVKEIREDGRRRLRSEQKDARKKAI